MESIKTLISHYTGIPKYLFLDKSRNVEIIKARQFYFYFLHYTKGLGVWQIGQMTGFTHSNVIHHIRKVDDLCYSDKDYRDRFNMIKNAIQGAIDRPKEKSKVMLPSKRITQKNALRIVNKRKTVKL